MKHWKKWLAAFLAVMMLVSLLAACGEKEEEKDSDKPKQTEETKGKEPTANENEDVNNEENNQTDTEDKEDNETPKPSNFAGDLAFEKVGLFTTDNFNVTDSGLYYRGENNLYGIISYEGLHDSGAIYTSLQDTKGYFVVSQKTPATPTDYANLNSCGLVDCRGNALIPMGYAKISVLSERYAEVYKAEAISNEEGNSLFTLYIDNERYNYNGSWYIYDMQSGKEVPGVTGKETCIASAFGQYIQYRNSEGNYQVVNGEGKAIVDGARLFSNGTYRVEGKIGEVLSNDGKLLFSYDMTGWIPNSFADGYYIASKYENGESKYVLLDTAGKVVSAEFKDYISLYDGWIVAEDGIYDFQGKKVHEIKEGYVGVRADTIFGNVWSIRDDKTYMLVDKDFHIYATATESDTTYVRQDLFIAYEEKGDEEYYYSHADGGFTLKADRQFAPWLVLRSAANFRYDLVNTITGETWLEGYAKFSCAVRDEKSFYVYAQYEGGAEVYLVAAKENLVTVEQKKEDLFKDLAAAFEKEGITAVINRESGEITLDSGVLFGGDSAELTDAGKAFLDKFIKVYSNVAFSAKYDGFITKTVVEGHTAPTPGSSYAADLPLSEDRANNVLAYCKNAEPGIATKPFESIGYANSRPIIGTDGEPDMAASRRVSFRFLVNVEQ